MSWDLGKTCQLTYAVIDYGLGGRIWDVLLSTFSHKLLKVRSSTEARSYVLLSMSHYLFPLPIADCKRSLLATILCIYTT